MNTKGQTVVQDTTYATFLKEKVIYPDRELFVFVVCQLSSFVFVAVWYGKLTGDDMLLAAVGC